MGIVAKRPSIIISRGGFSFMKLTINQCADSKKFLHANNAPNLIGPLGSTDRVKNAVFSDLIQGSLTFNVLSKQGIQAEAIANELYVALTGYKEDLRAKGIELKNISFGEESILKNTSEIEVSAITIGVQFTKQVTIVRGQKQNNCLIYLNTIEVQEGIHFRVETAGTQIVFENAPAIGVAPSITYVHAITLATHTEEILVGTVDGSNKTFTVPNSGVIYGYYTLLDVVETTINDATYD